MRQNVRAKRRRWNNIHQHRREPNGTTEQRNIMKKIQLRLPCLSFFIAVLFPAANSALADTFTTIVDTSTLIPDYHFNSTTGNLADPNGTIAYDPSIFTGFIRPAVNDNGQVAFPMPVGSNDGMADYVSNGTSISLAGHPVDLRPSGSITPDPSPGSSAFPFGNPTISNAGQIASLNTYNVNVPFVIAAPLTGLGQPVTTATTIAGLNAAAGQILAPPIPSILNNPAFLGSGTFYDPVRTSSGTYVSVGSGVWTPSQNGIDPITGLGLGGPILRPAATGPLSPLLPFVSAEMAANDNGIAIVRGSTASGSFGLWTNQGTGSPSLREIIQAGCKSCQFTQILGLPAINNANRIAFVGQLASTNQSGIFVTDDFGRTFQTVALGVDPGGVGVDGQGKVLYERSGSWYLWNGATSNLLFGPGTTVPRGQIDTLFNGALSQNGRIAFTASLVGGGFGIYRFDPSGLPVLPSTSANGAFQFSLTVTSALAPVVLDPILAAGYDYFSSGLNFVSLRLPTGLGINHYLLYLWDGNQFVFERSLSGDVLYTFSSGVNRFRILGLDAAGLDPTNPLAFPTTVTFSGEGLTDITMMPLAASVPEPSTWLLLASGLLGLRLHSSRLSSSSRRKAYPRRIEPAGRTQ